MRHVVLVRRTFRRDSRAFPRLSASTSPLVVIVDRPVDLVSAARTVGLGDDQSPIVSSHSAMVAAFASAMVDQRQSERRRVSRPLLHSSVVQIALRMVHRTRPTNERQRAKRIDEIHLHAFVSRGEFLEDRLSTHRTTDRRTSGR